MTKKSSESESVGSELRNLEELGRSLERALKTGDEAEMNRVRASVAKELVAIRKRRRLA
jgi:hypothetical protein